MNGFILGYPEDKVDQYVLAFHNELSQEHKLAVVSKARADCYDEWGPSFMPKHMAHEAIPLATRERVYDMANKDQGN